MANVATTDVRYRWTVLSVSVMAFSSTMLARVVISPLVPDIVDAFNVSKSAMGVALTGMWAAYALLQFPSGVLGEQYGERTVVITALFLTGLGSVALALSPSYIGFVLAAVFLGLGTGLYFSVATSLLTRLVENRGQALGLHSAGGPIAGLFGPIAAVWIAERFGWRAGLLLGAAIAFPTVTLYVRTIRPVEPRRPDTSVRDRVRSERLVEIFSNPSVVFTTGIGVLGYFKWQAWASFFPTFLVEYRSLSSGDASLVFGAVFALSAVGLPIMGRLSDLLSHDSVLVTSFGAAVAGYGCFFWTDDLTGLVAGTVALGLGMSWNGVLTSRYMNAFSADNRSAGFGFVRTISMLLGSLGSVVTGFLADIYGWPTAYGLVVALLCAIIVALVIAVIVDRDL